MTSLIKVDNIAPSAGGTEFSLTRGVAKAWVNFNGTGTVVIRDSENVSSLVDNGTADYDVNFSNYFGAFDYSVAFGHTVNIGSSGVATFGVYADSWTNTSSYSSTSKLRVAGKFTSPSVANETDVDAINLQIAGDLS
jgi:hypothetical protein